MEDFHSLSNRISGLQEDIFAVKNKHQFSLQI